jgi:hypothetical protein
MSNNAKVTLKCEKCNKDYQVKQRTYNESYVGKNKAHICRSCLCKDIAANRTPETKKKISDGAKNQWVVMSPEERAKRSNTSSKVMTGLWAGMTPEEAKAKQEKDIAHLQKHNANLTPEQRSENSRKGYNNQTDEQKEALRVAAKEGTKKYNENLSDREGTLRSLSIYFLWRCWSRR